MIRNYLKMAFRNLLRYKVQNTISILGIAAGFTAFLLGGYWYYWEHSFDCFHPDWKHTYAITTTGLFKAADGTDAELNQLHEVAEKEIQAYPEIKQICHVNNVMYESDKKERQWIGLQVDSVFFSMFQCQLMDGTYQGVPFNGNSVILTERVSRHYFGDSTSVGKVFKVNEKLTFTVAGVMKSYPQNSDFKVDYILLSAPKTNNVQRKTTYVQIYPHADIEKLRERIAALRMEKEDSEWAKYSEWRFNLRTLPEVHLTCSPELSARFRNINILAVAGLLAFASALMNLLVLFIGQQQRKVRYNATFSTLGASFGSLIGKNLLELILPLIAAFILSMSLFELVFPYYQEYTKLEEASNSTFQGVVQSIGNQEIVTSAVLLYPLVAILFLLISLFPIIALLKRKRYATSALLRNGLIAGQIFIGSLFLITSAVFYTQYRFMTATDKGIITDHIWEIDLGYDATFNTDCTPFVEELKKSPYIEDITPLSQPILSSRGEFYCSYIMRIPIEGRAKEDKEGDNCVVVSKNFFSFFGMKMKEGEWITNQGTDDIVVNETGARQLGISGLTGRPIETPAMRNGLPRTPRRISGVLADYYYCPMQYSISKTFFQHMDYAEMAKSYMGGRYFYIKVRPGNDRQALAYVESMYSKYDKGEVAPEKRFTYLPDQMEKFNRPEKTMFRIFLLLASLCILISSFGIYSLVALSTEQRKKEIAIRKVNGALFKDILRLFLKEYLWLALLGNAIALPLGYVFIRRWLDTYAYHTPLHGWLFVLVFLFTCIIVLFSVGRQVILAAKVNPAESVKTE